MKDVSKQVKLTVWKNRMKYEFLLPVGKNLRKVLIEKGVSPYSAFNNKINCRGNGLCATCGVFVMDSDPTPTHWHDRRTRSKILITHVRFICVICQCLSSAIGIRVNSYSFNLPLRLSGCFIGLSRYWCNNIVFKFLQRMALDLFVDKQNRHFFRKPILDKTNF